MWKNSRESSKCPSISWSWKSKVWGEREAASVCTDNTLRSFSLIYGCSSAARIPLWQAGSSRWIQDTPHQTTRFPSPWAGWVGLPHPKALQGPRVTKGFWITHKVQAEDSCHQCCLKGGCMPLMHQLGIRMTQKWELFFHLWTNSLVCLEVTRHHLTQNIFVKALHVRFLRIYFEKCYF